MYIGSIRKNTYRPIVILDALNFFSYTGISSANFKSRGNGKD